MILKKNKYLRHFIALIILASCSTTSKNIQVKSIESKEWGQNDLQEIFNYQSYSLSELKKIQEIIDSDVFTQEQIKDAKLLKNNYQKILSKKKYSLKLKPYQ